MSECYRPSEKNRRLRRLHSLAQPAYKRYWNRPVAYPVSLCVCFRKMYSGTGKMAEWIRMLFGVVSGVNRWIGVLDGVVIVEGEGAVL